MSEVPLLAMPSKDKEELAQTIVSPSSAFPPTSPADSSLEVKLHSPILHARDNTESASEALTLTLPPASPRARPFGTPRSSRGTTYTKPPVKGYEIQEEDYKPTLDRVSSFVPFVDEAAQGSMLIGAAARNSIQQMRELLDLGISPDSADYDKRSALHVACAEGHEDAVDLLVERGANVNLKDRFGLTPLDEAVKSRNDALVKRLIARGAQLSKIGSETSLLTIAAQGRPDDVPLAKLLLEAKVDANCTDYAGRAPLHLAVCESNVLLAEMLLDHGADPFKEDRWKCTPLMESNRYANRTGTNEMTRLFKSRVIQEDEESAWSIFTVVFAILQGIIIILFFSASTYNEGNSGGDEALKHADLKMYPLFQDVNVMVFIGFGYLMTFLRKNVFNSVGLTFMVATMCIEWHMLVNGFFEQAFCYYQRDTSHCAHGWHKVPLGLESMLFADFCAASVLITYGALLGKVTPAQLCVMAFFEVIFFSLNENFGKMLQITDIGGTMVIHMFGAYFGLAFSVATRTKQASTHINNSSVYLTDAFAMIGTIFLFLFWPSFNGAPSLNEAQQGRVIINTFLSISASCFCAFLASHVARKEHKFCMVDVQNATLAGGVGMGTCADLLITPGAAVSIGSIAGAVSVLGFVYVQPFLERKIGFHDTCGVNNLHGLPSIIGSLSGVIAAGLATEAAYGAIQLDASFPALANGSRTPGQQAGAQAAFIVVTLSFSLLTGFLTGYLTRMCVFMRIRPEFLFSDEQDWEVPGLENPYYFDHRGEIERNAPESDVGLPERLALLEAKLAALSQHQNSIDKKVVSQKQSAKKGEDVESLLVQVLSELRSRPKLD